jgi:hypothetical protein
MPKRVLFSGSIAGHAVGYGGNTWAFLQWVLGFCRFGFEVYYLEESRGPQFFDEQMKPVPFLESASARYFHKVMERDVDTAVQCLEAVERDYARHASAAREFAGASRLRPRA